MTGKLSKKKDTSEILTRKYSRKNRILKKKKLDELIDLVGGDPNTIDKNKLSYTYLLGLKFSQLNRKKFKRLLRILFHFKLRSEKEDLQMDVFRNGIKMMKYYQKLLKYNDIYQKITNKLITSVMIINEEINNTILILNKLLEKINARSSSIIDKNIIDDNTLLEMKIEYEAQKTKLNKLLLFRTDYALFRRNRFSLIKGSNIGYLIYLYRKAESKFNHIFYKFNEKTVNFINAMSNLSDSYGKKKSRTESITKKRLPLEKLDIEQFYDKTISYEFLPKNEELRKYFALKNFNTQDELVKAIEEWLTHYEKIITDLPTQLNDYKKINTSINTYGIVNNPFSKPFFHKEIRKQNIHTPSLLKDLKTLIDDLKKVYMPDTSQVQAGGASIPISQAYGKTQYHPSSSTSTPIRFLTPLEIKERMNQLKSTFSSFIVNGTQFNLNILEEIQIKLTQLIGNILYIANHKKSKNLPTYVDYMITFLKIINDKLMKRNYNEITDLKVLRDTFAKIILKNQLNLVKNISILISRLPESDTKNKVTLRYRNLRNQITELNMKVTTRIIKLNNGKPFSIDELPDGVKTQMGGTRSNYNYNYECSKELTSLKHGIIKRLIGYFNTNFKEHAKLDMGYLSIEPEITYYNYDDDELDARETGILEKEKERIKTKWYRLNQVYDRAFNPSHVDFEPYNKLRTRNFNMSFESFERINKFRNTETILKDKLKKAIKQALNARGSTNGLNEADKKKKKEEINKLKNTFKSDKAEKDENKKKIKTIMDINVIGRTKADKLGNRIKRTFGLNDSVKKINDITENLEEYNDCNNFKLLGDKLVETYFINNIPLFADRLLRLRRDASTENIINANNDDDFYRDISLPLGTIIFKKDNKHYDSSKNFNISYLEDLPTELKNDILVDKFIKKILMIPEKDLITMLTNFNQVLNKGECPDDKSTKTVGDNDILKENNKNFDKVYKGIFGYNNDNNAAPAAAGGGAAASTVNPIKRRNESEKVKIPVIAYSGYTSNNYEALAKKYPSVLFIYNDNFKEKYDKKEGNAIIRGRPNAFGIPIGAFKNDEAFETIEHSSSNKSNSINLDIKVIRDHCKKINDNNPTIRKILQTKLKELKEKVSPFSNSSSVFKAIVYTAKSNNSFDLNTETYGTENGTNNNITNFIRDEIIKKISNHTSITGHTHESGITHIDDETDLKIKLGNAFGINGTNQLIDFNANFKNLYESPVNNNNTIKVVNYKKKKTAVSTRFYQLKMKQLLVLICDRIKYYLNNEYPGVKDKDIFAYLLSIRNYIETQIDNLNNYLFKDDNKINSRTILDKIASSYDMKKHNPEFYKLTRDLVKNINEETQLTNLLYVIDMVHRYCIE
jgi:hypothetical protein